MDQLGTCGEFSKTVKWKKFKLMMANLENSLQYGQRNPFILAYDYTQERLSSLHALRPINLSDPDSLSWISSLMRGGFILMLWQCALVCTTQVEVGGLFYTPCFIFLYRVRIVKCTSTSKVFEICIYNFHQSQGLYWFCKLSNITASLRQIKYLPISYPNSGK